MPFRRWENTQYAMQPCRRLVLSQNQFVKFCFHVVDDRELTRRPQLNATPMRRRNLVCVLLGCVLLYGRVKGYVYMNDLCFSILHVCLSFKTSTSTKMVFIVVTSARGPSPQPTGDEGKKRSSIVKQIWVWAGALV